ncbi:MAG TPA: hypothetical protein VN328_01245 [Thermodesulfovibrionales bacterium]|nr:hypothetical protein [Thermodesulfovibrionales bacterium]
MKSENNISPRELELAIFEILASGCATYPEIKAGLFDIFRERTNSDNLNENATSRLSDESLYKFLSLLRKTSLIQSGKYFDRKARKNFSLYANTENSVEVLLRETTYRRNHIRSPYLPGKYSFWHDMDLTNVVRTIKRDGPIYSYDYGFEDEFALRRFAQKAKKGDLYPDLRLNIKARSGDEYFFRIEVQRSRDRLDEFATKLRDTRNNLVLCKDRRLIYDIADTHIYVRESALFALIDDFIEKGLFKTEWLSPGCQVVGLRYTKG